MLLILDYKINADEYYWSLRGIRFSASVMTEFTTNHIFDM